MCFKWYDQRAKNLGYVGVKSVKWASFALALMIAKLWPGILGLEWFWYMIIAIVFLVIAMFKFFKK